MHQFVHTKSSNTRSLNRLRKFALVFVIGLPLWMHGVVMRSSYNNNCLLNFIVKWNKYQHHCRALAPNHFADHNLAINNMWICCVERYITSCHNKERSLLVRTAVFQPNLWVNSENTFVVLIIWTLWQIPSPRVHYKLKSILIDVEWDRHVSVVQLFILSPVCTANKVKLSLPWWCLDPNHPMSDNCR